ncbi:MAG: GNAT family N-acetyltransferase [Actinomycetaceae bacterium]|nr:GNAT family N-acetyltransferase [Actinomycetaceae bacterium]
MSQTIPQIQWVMLDDSYSDEILDLVVSIEKEDGAPYRSALNEVKSFFSDVWMTRAIGGRTSDGVLIAFGLVRMPRVHGEYVEISLWGGIRPDYRNFGFGRELVGMQVRAAREMASDGVAQRASIVMHVDEGHDDLADLLKRDGFEYLSLYAQMRRKLDKTIETPVPPPFISFVNLTEDLDPQVRAVHNAIDLENSQGSGVTEEQWISERSYMNREWSFVALDTLGDRPRLAGYIISGKYEQDWNARGWSEGYIDEVAVYDEVRRFQLLRSLIAQAMISYQNDGIEYAGIDVPYQENQENNDMDFFKNLGFEVVGRTYVFSKEIDIQSTPVRNVVHAHSRWRLFRSSGS